MKGSIVAAAAVFVAGASASRLHHRHADAHKLFEKRAAADELCTTIINTITGDYCKLAFFENKFGTPGLMSGPRPGKHD